MNNITLFMQPFTYNRQELPNTHLVMVFFSDSLILSYR